MNDESVVDVDEEGELGAVRERRDVGALQLHRQLLVGLRSVQRATYSCVRLYRDLTAFSFILALLCENVTFLKPLRSLFDELR